MGGWNTRKCWRLFQYCFIRRNFYFNLQGYEDDIDYGDVFTYTGCGGRDLKGTKANPKNLRTADQTSDQELKGGNKALEISFQKKYPIRVIRGYKLDSPYAPKAGYFILLIVDIATTVSI